jgi:hypothetical protein
MDLNRERMGKCALCEREACDITEHHLIPRTTHKIKRFKKKHTVEAMHTTAPMCQPCHRAMHQFYTEKELADSFYTIDLLLADEKIAKHVSWVRKQKPGHRMKKSHKGRAK